MTNLKFLRTCDKEVLAYKLMHPVTKLNKEDEFEGGFCYDSGWETPDGKFFLSEVDAAEHTIEWLEQYR